MKITVILPRSFDTAQIWNLEVPAMPPEAAAELAFHLSNAPPRMLSESQWEILRRFPRTGIRSVSVGDMLIIQDPEKPEARHFLTVDPCGFTAH